MAWQGIPFPFDYARDISSFVIDKMPPMEINTGFAWDTVISSFIAGAIPAFIAWKALKNNLQLVEMQARQASRKELAEKLRIAVLDYICSVEILGMKSYLLLKDKSINKDDLEKGIFPDHYISAVHKAEREERHLCLLIEPTPSGMILLEKLPKFQDCVTHFLTYDDSFDNGIDELKALSDDFMLEFHKYIREY